MASPYNSTEQSNTRQSATGTQSGTQISKKAQLGNVSDANETIADHFDADKAPDWEAAPTEKKTRASENAQSTRTQMPRSQSANQGSRQMSQSADQAASGLDVLKGSLTGAFDQIVKEIEPQINEYATQFAHQAVAKSGDIGRQALKRVQSQSWGRIAFAGALIVGAVALLGYQAAEIASENESLH